MEKEKREALLKAILEQVEINNVDYTMFTDFEDDEILAYGKDLSSRLSNVIDHLLAPEELRLRNPEAWEKWEKENADEYGKSIMDVARRVMRKIQEPLFMTAEQMVREASREAEAGLSGYQAGAVAHMVSECHERGEDFRRSWNSSFQYDGQGAVNPAVVSFPASEPEA